MMKTLMCALFTGFCAHAPAHADNTNYLEYEELSALIQQTANSGLYSADELHKLFAGVSRQESVLNLMAKPAESRDWKTYRPIFLTSERIDAGVEFWRAHEDTLKHAEKQYGVPAEIILAILGVETKFGHSKGTIRVIDSLSTLAFDYPARAAYFRKELREYLQLCKQEGLDPAEVKGSYAGAMGYSQFMPSSWRTLAVDFNKDGKRDLINDVDDAIGSVANYFAQNGWKSGAPVAVHAQLINQDYDTAVTTELHTTSNIAQLRQKGLDTHGIPDETPASAIRLQGEHGGEFWIAMDNFYVITRYNHSPLYAMAVWQLSQEIRKAFEGKFLPANQEHSG